MFNAIENKTKPRWHGNLSREQQQTMITDTNIVCMWSQNDYSFSNIPFQNYRLSLKFCLFPIIQDTF